jgi:hypothetical protein
MAHACSSHTTSALTLALPPSPLPPPSSSYPNFDTFLNSLVSTFNILNLENYQNQQGAIVRATNWGAATYYLVWIFIGE